MGGGPIALAGAAVREERQDPPTRLVNADSAAALACSTLFQVENKLIFGV
ncbi:hypothetical protein B9Z65_7773 [Elsinoe australis]|uniref:Uncharacterized protein n=1 Tax=Elsinoe australis TaxID=40998 RepID=A0A2P8A0H4_9PEZI|nr:hypothetical protein B9Z65_7773 [Elsinoe australis]